MALEPNFRFIDDLDPLNPADADQVAQGDDHLRGLKAALQGSVDGNATRTRLLIGADPVFNVTSVQAQLLNPIGGAVTFLGEDANGPLGSLVFQPFGALQLSSLVAGQGVNLFAGNGERLYTGAEGGASTLFHADAPTLLTTGGGVNVNGVNVVIDNGGAATRAEFQAKNSVGGIRTAIGTTGELLIDQLSAAGALEGTFVRAVRDAQLELSFADVVRLATTSVGADVSGTSFNLDSSANNITRINALNSIGGVSLNARSTSGDGRISQMSAAGAEEAHFLTMERAGPVTARFNNVDALRTADHLVNGVTSSAQGLDHGGTFRDLGWNVLPIVERDSNLTLTELHASKVIRRDGAGNVDYTLPNGPTGTVPPIGAVTMFTNFNAAGNVDILPEVGGALLWLDGAGTPQTGSRRLAHGGIATVLHYTDLEWWIWGTGIS